MSARTRILRPAQAFKKRVFQVNSQVASGSISTATITIDEAGTIYAVRAAGGFFHNKALSSTNRVQFSLQTGRNGFAVTQLMLGGITAVETADWLLLASGLVAYETVTPINDAFIYPFDRKYRFRRKVKHDDQIKIVFENLTTVGSATDATCSAIVIIWIRTK